MGTNSKNCESDLSWYFGKDFTWPSSAQTFYRIMVGFLLRNYGHWFDSEKDFEDNLHDSFEKFCVALQTGFYEFEKNGEAVFTLKKIFRNTMVSAYRKKTRRQKKLSLPENGLADQELIDPFEEENKITARLIFNVIDRIILQHPRLMEKKVYEFYEVYKLVLLEIDKNEEIRTVIMSKMNIQKGHYSNLKTKLTRVLKEIFNP